MEENNFGALQRGKDDGSVDWKKRVRKLELGGRLGVLYLYLASTWLSEWLATCTDSGRFADGPVKFRGLPRYHHFLETPTPPLSYKLFSRLFDSVESTRYRD